MPRIIFNIRKYIIDFTFFIFLLVSAYFIGMISLFIYFSYYPISNLVNVIQGFSFSDFTSAYMFIGIVYVFGNLGEKALANNKNFVVDENGKLKGKTKRKMILWILWSLYFAATTFLFFRLNDIEFVKTIDFKIVDITWNYIIITSIVMGAEVSQGFFAAMPSPVAQFFKKEPIKEEEKLN